MTLRALPEDSATIALLELSIRAYKNLRDFVVPWHPRVILYGANGSGKTNVLEALALCFGSNATMRQLAARIDQPKSGAISAVLQTARTELPLAPIHCFDDAQDRFLPPLSPSEELSDEYAAFLRSSARFWQSLSLDDLTAPTWDTAIRTVLSPQLSDWISSCTTKPTIRYTLLEFESSWPNRGRFDVSANSSTLSAPVRRRFARTLVVHGSPPQWLIDCADELPKPFAPLRKALRRASPKPDYTELMVLPPSHSAPVRAVWLASERTSEEAWFDLHQAYATAQAPAADLANLLDGLHAHFSPSNERAGVVTVEDLRFWLTVVTTEVVATTVKRVFPEITPVPKGADPQDIILYRSRAPEEGARVGALRDQQLFHNLSSGERTWVDIALAQASAELDATAVSMSWLAYCIKTLSDDSLLEAALNLDQIGTFNGEYWNVQDLNLVLGYFQELLTPRLTKELPRTRSDLSRSPSQEARDAHPILREALRPTLLLHVYDEPERHLHSEAQRRAIQAFGESDVPAIAIATHSHLFLGSDGWKHIHLARQLNGPVPTMFDPGQLSLRSRVTADLGLTRGELLSAYRYILFVEGVVDEMVLETLYSMRSAGILVLPIHGVDEAASLAELELIGRILDTPAGILTDHTRSAELTTRRPSARLTKEERALRDLRDRMARRGESFDFFGLSHADILEYLPDDSVRFQLRSFPGWQVVRQSRLAGERLKDALLRLTGHTLSLPLARLICEQMRSADVRPLADLDMRVSEIVAAATHRR